MNDKTCYPVYHRVLTVDLIEACINRDKGFTGYVTTFINASPGTPAGRYAMFKAGDVVDTDFEGFLKLLRSKTRAFLTVDDHDYYVTHTDGYWRVQDCENLNEKGHFSDCSDLVNTLCEVVELPWIQGKSLHDNFVGATVYEAVHEEERPAA